ncbi:hypothetical protein NPD5_1443 [Clostridium sporogenes]|uniref:Uncharacterized protein n=1 Tax=Clostridium sporogenes TaxID=1509 RepID=A0A1L3NGS6_CLOSG|nr:hypothetical protein NPD5_1443 [Clostridium sporogenes]
MIKLGSEKILIKVFIKGFDINRIGVRVDIYRMS